MKKMRLFSLQVILTLLVSIWIGDSPGIDSLCDYGGYFFAAVFSVLTGSYLFFIIGIILSSVIRLSITYGLCTLFHKWPLVSILADLLIVLFISFTNGILLSH